MNENLGKVLREERTKLKMTQHEFADYIEMERSTYERLENNRNGDIKLDSVVKILRKIKNFPIELFIPIEILNRYCVYVKPKQDTEIKNFLSKEFSKLVKKVDFKFSSNSKSKK